MIEGEAMGNCCRTSQPADVAYQAAREEAQNTVRHIRQPMRVQSVFWVASEMRG